MISGHSSDRCLYFQVISDIKRAARENSDLQQSYENDGVVTCEAMTTALKNWVAHAIDESVKKETPPEELIAVSTAAVTPHG